jgi:hypothetical protein
MTLAQPPAQTDPNDLVLSSVSADVAAMPPGVLAGRRRRLRMRARPTAAWGAAARPAVRRERLDELLEHFE